MEIEGSKYLQVQAVLKFIHAFKVFPGLEHLANQIEDSNRRCFHFICMLQVKG